MTRNPFMVESSNGSPTRSPQRPGLTRFRTNNSSSYDGSMASPNRDTYNNLYDEYDDDDDYSHSKQFQGLPPAIPQSPSRAAMRYSPDRRHRTQFYRDSNHATPVSNSRYATNLHESPRRGNDVVLQFSDSPIKQSPAQEHYTDNLKKSPRKIEGQFLNINHSYPDDEDDLSINNMARNYDADAGNDYHSSMDSMSYQNQTNRNYSRSSKNTVSTSSTEVRSSFDSEEKFRKSFDDNSTVFSTDTFTETKFELNHPVRRDYVRRANSESKRRPTTNEVLKKAILKLDNPIPRGLLNTLPRRDKLEFTEMRYTACTVDPDEFQNEGYSLRFAEMNRECQIVVCVTMYNEDKYALARTLHSIMKNVSHLCRRKRSQVWGPDGWKKVSVILISDGRSKVNQGALDYLAALGVYQEDMAKASVNGDQVKAHIFELTTQISINDDLDYVSKDIVPVQLVFCLKEENKKKINSHRWLLNAFCPVLQPTVVTLVDVGTQLNHTAVYHLWKAFDNDSNVAGAAGQIKTIKGKYGLKLFNPLVASQNFEYKISNILDKPLESLFGYISVLPGALSAYRYRALQNHADGTGPLHSYFLGETQEGRDHDVFTANMYLAEDRILCWELVAKRDAKWVLKYVKEATGATDVPEEIPEFISQRRRWLNGAMFAALYAQLHFFQIWKTKHSITRLFFLQIEFVYQLIQMLFSWFSIANFVLTFYYLAGSLNEVLKHGEALFIFLKYLIFCDLACLFIISMGNRPQGGKHLYITSMVILTICALYSLICGFTFAIRSMVLKEESHSAFVNIVVSMLSTYGCYIFSSFMYLDPWHIFTSSLQYFITLPAFTCTLQIYAFCNTHDVSWGTKGSTGGSKQLSKAIVLQGPDGKQIVETDWPQEVDKKYLEIKSRLKEPEVEIVTVDEGEKRNDYYRDIRTRIVMFWMLSNLILIMSIIEIFDPQETNNGYLIFILWSVAALSIFRVVGSMGFLFMKYLRMIVSYTHKSEETGSWGIQNLNPFHKEK
ncbi:similar to Saccharomyces cerevisiae YBR038W CHS2 Chitin synthase II [Maudiozyma saulgeensis]|uniref:chitin synthase n=1 Tax=Maudiozyma saulgeensis TaxID=1789683 RepID=A0A1X7R3J2_9SACH|nr:similar to Saccharomyces cerevisiae YBR038W CHS2 Chitin synthase II [Kazachstania saulgeensis]